jgi:uncharacterized protein YgbK (DUF1537 family)
MPPASLHEPRIVVLADDLSGAAEIAGIAFGYGLSAEVQRQFEPATVAEVIAVDTDSRVLPSAGAAQCLRTIGEQVVATRPGWIFKKVDSLLRGNVRAEIEALLDVAGQRRAILIPANPSRGRVITGGRYFVDGMPLDQTPLAADPNHPRRSADVRELLGDDGELHLHVVADGDSLPADGIIVPDVSTRSDLERFACGVTSDTLAAGAADFFAALLDRNHRQRLPVMSVQIVPPALLVCGSRASWPLRRADCQAAGIPVIALADNFRTGNLVGALALGIGERDVAIVHDLFRAGMLRLTESFLQSSGVRTLLIEGGATAAVIAEHFGWTQFTVTARAPAGVGVLQPIGARAPLVVIKPGSYPWPREIWEQFRRCHLNQPDSLA